MRHQDQVAEARKLLSYLDTHTTAMVESIYRNPVSDYTCRRHAELEVFFGRGPINIQRGFYSRAQDDIIFGRNEPALQHYHRALKSALAPAVGS